MRVHDAHGRQYVFKFEAATTFLIAVAAQALVVGAILAA